MKTMHLCLPNYKPGILRSTFSLLLAPGPLKSCLSCPGDLSSGLLVQAGWVQAVNVGAFPDSWCVLRKDFVIANMLWA